ncbi:MAG: hypothetical protein QOG34_126 [Frankiaceae bacterium]|nr:hypothetical protein [Frankiaceae bacterium]
MTTNWASGEIWYYVSPKDTSVVGAVVLRAASGLDGDTEMRYQMDGTTDRCDAAFPCTGETTYSWAGALPAIAFRLWCDKQDTCRSATGTSDGAVDIARVAIEIQDTEPPRFSSPPTGGLLSSPVRGNQSVAFTAEDVGGGVYQAALVIDGREQPRQIVDANGGSCRAPFVHQVPCKLTAASGSLSLDTTTLADGHHDVSVVVYDATGTNNVTFGPVPIEVDNVPDPGGNGLAATGGSGAKLGPRPNARLVGIGRPTRQAFGRRGVARGKLVDGDGKAIGGAGLDVYATDDVPNARERLIGHATTGPDGAFRFVIPKGPSRHISVRFAEGVAWTFDIVVPAPIKLVASRPRLKNGQKLVLTSYLSGIHVPARSAAVAFQVLIGHQWRTFATRNVGRTGLARVGHRFRVTYQRLTYRFRAVIVGRRNFPFANATSPGVAVRVN